MSIYAISDLHLSLKNGKTMEIFGDNWLNHEQKIKEDWDKKVTDNDLVLLPGDFSWETYLKDTDKDFEFLSKLKGKKLLLKGNHDYWWTTLTNMRKYLKENNFENIDFLYNNSYCYENYIIAGTRGWSDTEEGNFEKMVAREKNRLELSLENGIKNFGEDKDIIVCMHYPPTREFIEVMKRYNVKKCIYGHLHGMQMLEIHDEVKEGIEFNLVSSDYLGFSLKKIC